jgi:hypothetical protein
LAQGSGEENHENPKERKPEPEASGPDWAYALNPVVFRAFVLSGLRDYLISLLQCPVFPDFAARAILVGVDTVVAKPRWYRLTPDRLILGLLAVEGLLWLSERFR